MIADDYKLIHHGMKRILEDDGDIKVIADACNGRSAVYKALQYRPDIILMGISIPELNGFDATRRILSDNDSIKVIAFSTFAEFVHVIQMLKSGAAGFVHKSSSVSHLKKAIRTVYEGHVYLCPDTTTLIMNWMMQPSKHSRIDTFTHLSCREREILQLIAEGKTSAYIADILNLSKRTVDGHRKNLMEKLNIFTIAELTQFAVNEGLTCLDF